jgi:hypothetical protein
VTETERRDRLIQWLKVIYGDVQHLMINDHLFWEFQEVVHNNDRFKSASGLFTQFIATSYTQSAAVGVRRQAKLGDDSASAMRFLDELRKYPQLVSRAYNTGLYAGMEDWQIDMGQRDFDNVAGPGSLHVPAALAEKQMADVKTAVSRIEHFVDRRVAHLDNRNLAQPLPKFFEITDALRALETIVILYWRLLTGGSLRTLLPTIQDDWKDIFRFTWEP